MAGVVAERDRDRVRNRRARPGGPAGKRAFSTGGLWPIATSQRKLSSKPSGPLHGRVDRDNASSRQPIGRQTDVSCLYTFSGTFPATMDIWALPLFGERKPLPVAQTGFAESQGTFSPDGRWIAYTSDEAGQPNVYLQPFLRAGGKHPISLEWRTESALAGRWPRVVLSRRGWDHDGGADRPDR